MRADIASLIQLRDHQRLSKRANRVRRKERILRRYYTGSRNTSIPNKSLVNPVQMTIPTELPFFPGNLIVGFFS